MNTTTLKQIMQSAKGLTDEELEFAIAQLNDMLSARYYEKDTATTPSQEFQKEVKLAPNTELGFILDDFTEYIQGHLYLFCQPNGDQLIYILMTIDQGNIIDIFILKDGKQDWQEQLAPHVKAFFSQGSNKQD